MSTKHPVERPAGDQWMAVGIAGVVEVAAALGCYASYQARGASDHPARAYMAGWTAVWLVASVLILVGLMAALQSLQEERRKVLAKEEQARLAAELARPSRLQERA